MSTILIRRRHALGLVKAKHLAESMAHKLQKEHGGSFTWKGDDLHFERTGASGSVAVTKNAFQVRLELGWLLSPLASRIEREIVTFCDEHLGEADNTDRPASSQGTRRPPRRRRGAKSS